MPQGDSRLLEDVVASPSREETPRRAEYVFSLCWENIPRAISLTELVVRKHHHGTILGAAELTSEAVRVS